MMLCDRCKKNEAVVYLTKIVNGHKQELHLCEKCAEETGHINFAPDNNLSFQKFLSGVLNSHLFENEKEIKDNNNSKSRKVCSRCGSSFEEFSQKGLFGCAECYDAFSEKLEPLMKRIHGSTYHSGKIPRKIRDTVKYRRDINKLKKLMDEAVAEENFEKAAEIRDKIRVIKNSMEED
ncbi:MULTISPECIES: UvrB/UvrC motif-containing protein [unclassified Halanaerobium]|uniref:UvrB/UvrC motif-containing protein n=1 Tax=unclassified Halanaerobium TaxID=2641197 RepID=UPI000E1482A5|nr:MULTISPECIES: UvrB/UvrC motif-containing protein [unclassified Halanaerobium]RCW41247.1 protein arginine kinase activator [Halanaerobium sp. MA284_MarDTE_T2]RCW79656.1 protein arginine kinase activator [Halanaerobium sp. DL-01]